MNQHSAHIAKTRLHDVLHRDRMDTGRIDRAYEGLQRRYADFYVPRVEPIAHVESITETEHGLQFTLKPTDRWPW